MRSLKLFGSLVIILLLCTSLVAGGGADLDEQLEGEFDINITSDARISLDLAVDSIDDSLRCEDLVGDLNINAHIADESSNIIESSLVSGSESIRFESEHPYANDFDYTWTISQPGADQVRIHFDKLELDGYYDTIRIYDDEWNLLVTYRGWTSQEKVWTEWQSTDTLKVRLTTNNAGTAYGFLIDKIEYRDDTIPSTEHFAESYHPYANDFDYTWTISQPGADQVRIHFDKLELDGYYDTIRIYDDEWNLLVTYRGWTSQEKVWTEWQSTDTLKVRLTTNDAGTAYGFLIDKIEYRDDTIPSTEHFAESYHPYANDFDYTWTISQPGADQVRIHFDKLELDGYYDTIRIYDDEWNLLVTYRGWTSQEKVWTEWQSTDTLKVRLTTNDAGTAYGFLIDKIEYRDDTIPSTEHFAESYHPYANDFDYTWTISQPGADQVRIHFDKLELDGYYDTIRIYDDEWNLLVTYRGWTSQEKVWTEWQSTDTLKVRLTTNDAGTAYGFLIDKIEYRDDTIPSTEHFAESYHPYANDFDYTWTISQPGADQVRIHFDKLELDGYYDTIRIYDDEWNLLVTYRGWTSQEKVWTEWQSTDTLKVRLTTNNAGTAYGFLIDKIETDKGIIYPPPVDPEPTVDDPEWTGDFNDDPVQILLARAIFGEARGEPDEGKLAVGWVIRNRADNPRWWGSDYHSVILKDKQFSCFNSDDPNFVIIQNPLIHDETNWRRSYDIAGNVISGNKNDDITLNSDHFYSISISPPYWVDEQKFVKQIGNHKFYRLELSAPESDDEPKLHTDPATEITETTATLHGHLQDGEPGKTYDVCFRYEGGNVGKTKVGHTSVTAASPNYEYTLTGLNPGTTYYYRAVHQDSQGVGDSKHQMDADNHESFTTLGEQPSGGRYIVNWENAAANGWFNPMGINTQLWTHPNYDFDSQHYSDYWKVRHTGVDFVSASGEDVTGWDVHAIADGEVIQFYGLGSYNEAVIIQHDSLDGQFFAVYGHINTAGRGLEVGSTVDRGQVIGIIRAGGNPDHLHFGINTKDNINDFIVGGNGWGRTTLSTDPRNIGWEDPITFLENRQYKESTVLSGVYRNGWWILKDGTRTHYGTPTDIPVVVNGKIGVFRNGLWIVKDGIREQFGTPTDIPVVVDGTIGVYRNGLWILKDGTREQFGTPTDVPVVVDGTIGVYRNGLWILKDGTRTNYGTPTDIPVVVDGKIGVYRNGLWIIKDGVREQFGLPTDIPVVVPVMG